MPILHLDGYAAFIAVFLQNLESFCPRTHALPWHRVAPEHTASAQWLAQGGRLLGAIIHTQLLLMPNSLFRKRETRGA